MNCWVRIDLSSFEQFEDQDRGRGQIKANTLQEADRKLSPTQLCKQFPVNKQHCEPETEKECQKDQVMTQHLQQDGFCFFEIL